MSCPNLMDCQSILSHILEHQKSTETLQNLRRSATSHDSNVLYTILLECKLAQGTTDAFIRDVMAAPTPQSVLFFDWELMEMKKFLPNNCNFGILNVDTMFNLGNFNVIQHHILTSCWNAFTLESILLLLVQS